MVYVTVLQLSHADHNQVKLIPSLSHSNNDRLEALGLLPVIILHTFEIPAIHGQVVEW